MSFRKQNVENAERINFHQDHCPSENKILNNHLKSLLDNNYLDVGAGDDETSSLIGELTTKLQKFVIKEICYSVDLSIEANETAIYSAKMLSNLKEVDIQTQGISSAAEEMVATVKEIERYGLSISDQSQEAQNATQLGETVVQSASEDMININQAVTKGIEQVQILSEYTSKISGIADDIQNIAKQTNLLALNATIEAARAGEAGKGFAVVAGEVKALSQETEKSTGAIAEIITNIEVEMQNVLESMDNCNNAVQSGQSSMEEVSEHMGEINIKISVVTQNAAEISNTLGEQNVAANEVAKGISSIAENSTKSVQGIEYIVNSMDKVEKILCSQIAELSAYEVPHKIVKLAQSDHVLWKKRLANMIAGREGLNAEELADHHSCRLGKWYDKVTEPEYVNHASFKALMKPHEDVHTHGINAVKLYNDGKIKEALEEIEKVEEASKLVLKFLSDLFPG